MALRGTKKIQGARLDWLITPVGVMFASGTGILHQNSKTFIQLFDPLF